MHFSKLAPTSQSAMSDLASITTSVDVLPGNVEDIFTQYLIPQIQKLSKNYRDDAERAKNDLFKLVGHKYRDLVEIAEDIRAMYADSMEVNERLSTLAYSKLNFKDFTNTNQFARFDSDVRNIHAQKSRVNGKTTILKNLIYDRLVSIDLGLKTKVDNSAVDEAHQLQAYINYSKIYFTIESVFADIFQADIYLKAKFDYLKSRFRAHLEALIAEHNSWVGSYGSQHTTLHSLIRHYNMSLDIGLEELSEMILGDVDIDDSQLHGNGLPRQVQPLVSILCAYVILNLKDPELDTITKVFEKFAEIRTSYVNTLMSNLLSSSSAASDIEYDFLKLFLYIENTCNYIKTHFDSPTLRSNLVSTLKQNTENWSVTDVIGFRNWFEIDTVKFNHQLYEVRIPESSLEAVNDMVVTSVNQVSILCDGLLKQAQSSLSEEESLTIQAQKLCYNFFIDLINLSRFCYGQGCKCNVIRLLQDNGLLSSVLQNVGSSMTAVYDEHLNRLMQDSNDEPKGGLCSTLTTSSHNSTHSALFSQPLFDMLDNSVEMYLETVHDIATSTFFIPKSAALGSAQVEQWFTKVNQLHNLLGLTSEEKVVHGESKYNLFALAEQLNEADASKLFGDLVDKEVSSLKDGILQRLWTRIEKFVDYVITIFEVQEENNDINTRYDFLRILLSLEENLGILLSRLPDADSHDPSNISNKIEVSCRKNIAFIFEQSLAHPIATQFQDGLNDYLHNKSARCGPSNQFTGLIYHLSSVFLTPTDQKETSEYENIRLYQSSVVKSEFTKLKREWIVSELIRKFVEQLKNAGSAPNEKANELEEPTESEETNGTRKASKDEPDCIRLLTDIQFLLSLVHEESTTSSYIKEAGISISEETVDKIRKDVSEFYASSKHVFLPLLI